MVLCAQADTGTKMVHIGKNTRSRIISKGISAGQSRNCYRGLVQARPLIHPHAWSLQLLAWPHMPCSAVALVGTKLSSRGKVYALGTTHCKHPNEADM